ncbi:hypothetical protein NPIL_366881, partial [Nephila pilipes]
MKLLFRPAALRQVACGCRQRTAAGPPHETMVRNNDPSGRSGGSQRIRPQGRPDTAVEGTPQQGGGQ